LKNQLEEVQILSGLHTRMPKAILDFFFGGKILSAAIRTAVCP